MSQAIVCPLASQWFDEYRSLAYWLGRRWTARLAGYAGRFPSPELLDELAQDAVARGYGSFAHRCAKHVCGESDRKRWICQCVIAGARDAVRAKSTFGTISDRTAIRDDAMNRLVRVRAAGFAHGSDADKLFALDSVADEPLPAPAQRWEIEAIINRELPAHLRPTAIYAACGLEQKESGMLQGICARTVRARLREIADVLNPMACPYAVVVAALEMVRAEL